MEHNEELQFNKTKLKVQALLESTTRLADEVAEYRAEITLLTEQNKALYDELTKLREENVAEVPDESVEEPQADSDPDE